MYFIVSIIFIPLGVIIYIHSTRLISTSPIRYDNDPMCDVGPGEAEFGDNPPERNCRLSIEIKRDITAPSYFYYGLVNFYQNARTYVESRNFQQLRGNPVSEGEAGSCDPLITYPNGTVIVPCGLVANSRFNDSFLLCRDSNCEQPVTLNADSIAWDIDVEKRFRPSDSYTEEQNQLIQSQDFMVWMRAAAYRNWKKLYRRIDDDLPAGTYTVSVTSRFPVESFGGEKFFFISETTWFGGPNEILGISYIVVGGVALLLAIMILIKSKQSPDLDLPPETTVPLEGISPEVRREDGRFEDEER